MKHSIRGFGFLRSQLKPAEPSHLSLHSEFQRFRLLELGKDCNSSKAGKKHTHKTAGPVRPLVVWRDDLTAKIFRAWSEELIYCTAAIVQDWVGVRNLAARHNGGFEQLKEWHFKVVTDWEKPPITVES